MNTALRYWDLEGSWAAGGTNLTYTASDTLATAEATFRGYQRSLVDTEALSESILRVFGRSVTDSEALSENVTRRATRTLVDSESLAENLTRSYARILSEGLTLSEAASRGYTRRVDDPLALLDSYITTGSGLITRILTDSSPLTETIARKSQRVLVDEVRYGVYPGEELYPPFYPSDGDTVETNLVTSFVTSAVALDSLAVSDSASRLLALGKSSSDSLSLSDNISTSTASQISKAVSDALALADAVSRVSALARNTTDSESFTDTLARSFTRGVTDSESFTDTLARSFTRGITDSESFTDTLARSFSRRITDSESFTDILVRSFSRRVTDSETFSEFLGKGVIRRIADLEGFADSLGYGYLRSIVDAALLPDILSKAQGFKLTVADSNTLIDSYGSIGTGFISRTLTDGVSPVESFSKASSRGLLDSMTLGDVLLRALGKRVSFTDLISTGDNTDRSSGLYRMATDSLPLGEALLSLRQRHLTLADALTITDLAGRYYDALVVDTVLVDEEEIPVLIMRQAETPEERVISVGTKRVPVSLTASFMSRHLLVPRR